MLIRYDLDYKNYIEAGYSLIARIEKSIAKKEAFVGTSKQIDTWRTQSLLISAIVDHLQHDDNESPISNETFLQCLNKLITSNIC